MKMEPMRTAIAKIAKSEIVRLLARVPWARYIRDGVSASCGKWPATGR